MSHQTISEGEISPAENLFVAEVTNGTVIGTVTILDQSINDWAVYAVLKNTGGVLMGMPLPTEVLTWGSSAPETAISVGLFVSKSGFQIQWLDVNNQVIDNSPMCNFKNLTPRPSAD
ncbi:hypothetical protein [Pseudomethylobacillus aquaticus]|uniref:hypothetical protein n=1 Tax=Pseudomethylobacillus aquaticus TaxID=2676064 RepID=UPI0011CDD18F|nr:hypothetical protein [Pseudomethylobacillus aquaticus]